MIVRDAILSVLAGACLKQHNPVPKKKELSEAQLRKYAEDFSESTFDVFLFPVKRRTAGSILRIKSPFQKDPFLGGVLRVLHILRVYRYRFRGKLGTCMTPPDSYFVDPVWLLYDLDMTPISSLNRLSLL